MPLSTSWLEYGRLVGQLRRRRRRRRAYAPTSNTAYHENHHRFPFLFRLSMGLAAEAPLIFTILFSLFFIFIRSSIREWLPAIHPI